MLDYGAATDLGNQRDNNEDSFVSSPEDNLWIVADGMGGLGFGEVASAITCFTITSMLKQGHGINQSIELSHQRIKEYAQEIGSGTNMGTTLVLLYTTGSLYNVFWVGDSRAYLYDGGLVQISHDHSLVQALVDQGEISSAEAAADPRKSAITRALGVQELNTVRADSVSEKWKPGQMILLCSDGLTDCVDDVTIAGIIATAETAQQAVDALISRALAQGGKDNITAVLVAAPPTTTDATGDTEFPNENTAGWQGGSSEAQRNNDVTQSMERSPIYDATAGMPGTAKVEPVVITEKKNYATTEFVNVEPQADSVVVEEQPLGESRAPLLSDRYLIPLALVLAVLLIWNLFLSGEDSSPDRSPITEEDSPVLGSTTVTGDMMAELEAMQGYTRSGSVSVSVAKDHLLIAASLPPIERSFPAEESHLAATIYQVGVYSNLERAENRQVELLERRLNAQIDKLAGVEGIQYAVQLGPLTDHEEDRRVRSILDREKIAYYRMAIK